MADKQQKLLYSAPTSDEDILRCFQSWDEWLTRKQIAERVFRRKTPLLTARIERMVADGLLDRLEKTMPNNVVVYWYRRASQQR